LCGAILGSLVKRLRIGGRIRTHDVERNDICFPKLGEELVYYIFS
jgi:hypothetical protein